MAWDYGQRMPPGNRELDTSQSSKSSLKSRAKDGSESLQLKKEKYGTSSLLHSVQTAHRFETDLAGRVHVLEGMRKKAWERDPCFQGGGPL